MDAFHLSSRQRSREYSRAQLLAVAGGRRVRRLHAIMEVHRTQPFRHRHCRGQNDRRRHQDYKTHLPTQELRRAEDSLLTPKRRKIIFGAAGVNNKNIQQSGSEGAALESFQQEVATVGLRSQGIDVRPYQIVIRL